MLLETGVVGTVLARRRRELQVRQWAADHDWTVTVRPTGVAWVAQVPFGFARGGVHLLVSGTVSGRPVSVAEYITIPPMGTGLTPSHFIVTVVQMDKEYAPLEVVHRGALSRWAWRRSPDAPTATGHEEFDQRFKIKTRRPELVRTLFGPALVAEHVADRVPTWKIAGQTLLTWQDGQLTDPHQIPVLAARLMRVAEMLGH